jgi:hypothetical protein
MARWRVGVDSGGTFTDICLFDEQAGRIETWKVPSTPDDPSRGIAEGVALITGVLPRGDVGEVAAAVLAIAFAWAALSKIASARSWRRALSGYGLPAGVERIATVGVPVAEATVLLLVLLGFPLAAGIVATGLLIAFSGAILVARARRGDRPDSEIRAVIGAAGTIGHPRDRRSTVLIHFRADSCCGRGRSGSLPAKSHRPGYRDRRHRHRQPKCRHFSPSTIE